MRFAAVDTAWGPACSKHQALVPAAVYGLLLEPNHYRQHCPFRHKSTHSLVIVAILHSPFRALYFNYYDSICGDCSYLGLYRVTTLSANYHLSLPAASQPWVLAVGWVGEVNTINMPKGSENRQLSRKIMAVWEMRSYSAGSALKSLPLKVYNKNLVFYVFYFLDGGKFILV